MNLNIQSKDLIQVAIYKATNIQYSSMAICAPNLIHAVKVHGNALSFKEASDLVRWYLQWLVVVGLDEGWASHAQNMSDQQYNEYLHHESFIVIFQIGHSFCWLRDMKLWINVMWINLFNWKKRFGFGWGKRCGWIYMGILRLLLRLNGVARVLLVLKCSRKDDI